MRETEARERGGEGERGRWRGGRGRGGEGEKGREGVGGGCSRHPGEGDSE